MNKRDNFFFNYKVPAQMWILCIALIEIAHRRTYIHKMTLGATVGLTESPSWY